MASEPWQRTYGRPWEVSLANDSPCSIVMMIRLRAILRTSIAAARLHRGGRPLLKFHSRHYAKKQRRPFRAARYADGTRHADVSDRSMPDDDRHFRCRRRVAAALGADDAVDDGHADAREVAELHAVQDVVAGGVLRLVHDDEVGRAPDFDDAAVQRAHPRGIAGRKAERDFRRHL